MAAKAKEFRDCTHCGASDATGTDEAGFKVIMTKQARRYISCPCGIMTRICPDIESLKEVWNSRPGKRYVKPVIEVKSPLTTKVDPSLLSTGDDTTKIPDEF